MCFTSDERSQVMVLKSALWSSKSELDSSANVLRLPVDSKDTVLGNGIGEPVDSKDTVRDNETEALSPGKNVAAWR
jgi:hypothetical protein